MSARGDFAFMFEDCGPVWEADMTREQLLQVIKTLRGEVDFWKAEARQNLTLAAAKPSKHRFWW